MALHLLLIGLLLALRTGTPEQQVDEPAMAVEFEPDQSQAPAGTNTATQPQINIVPPEYQQMAPPEAEEAEPLPPPMPLPRFRPTQPSRVARNNPFSHPLNFSYAPRDEHQEPAGLRNSRGLDLSAGPVVRGGRLTDSIAHTVGPGDLEDYDELLNEFVERHKYYPAEAGERGEDGAATVEVTVTRDGKVVALKIISSSGSRLLDAAWLGVFRDNRLPPLPDGFPPTFTFKYTLDYVLIYGRPPG